MGGTWGRNLWPPFHTHTPGQLGPKSAWRAMACRTHQASVTVVTPPAPPLPPEDAAVTKEGELPITPCENSTPHTSSWVYHRTQCWDGGGDAALNSLPKGSETHGRVAKTEAQRVWLVWALAMWPKVP